MEQPRDKLGQPLKVGDRVIFNSTVNPSDEGNGKELLICGFRSGLFSSKYTTSNNWSTCILGDDSLYYDLSAIAKVFPKQEVTTWGECVWQPEGVGVKETP